MRFRKVVFITVITVSGLPLFGQTPHPSPMAATAPTVVPALIPYTAIAADSEGKTLVPGATGGDIGMTFLLFKDESGGEPMWTESQRVTVDANGRYAVQLGASSPSGLPLAVFALGEARWLEVQIAGQKQQPRVLMSSVPYAAKAADAATLGGLPASAFVLAGSPAAASLAVQAVSDAASNVTTTGGTSGYVPQFTGTSTVANSQIFVSSAGVGINKTSPAATLDVNGDMIVRGSTIVARTGNATSAKGYPSNEFAFYANAYNSSTKVATNPHFQMQSEPVGNNTASPSATFNFLYANGGTPAETGFYINPNGTLHFATGQTFPGGGGSGITQITAGTDLTGGGTSGNVTLNLDTTKVPVLKGENTFNGTQTVIGDSSGEQGLGATGIVYGLVGEATGTGISYAGVDGEGPVGVKGYGTLGVAGYADQAPGPNPITGVQAQYGTASNEITSIENGNLNFNGTNLVAGLIADGGQNDPTTLHAQPAILGTTDNDDAAYFFNNSAAFQTLVAENDYQGGPVFSAFGTGDNDPTCSIDGAADLECTGYIAGSNVALSTGRTVMTYGVQSAENWYEDAGSGQLQGGSARIDLESTFGDIVNTSVDYHVFLTPLGESNGLYAVNKTATGFEVHEIGHGTSSIPFDYRIMAKRKGYEKIRLEDKTEERRQQAAMRLKHHLGPAAKHAAVKAELATAK